MFELIAELTAMIRDEETRLAELSDHRTYEVDRALYGTPWRHLTQPEVSIYADFEVSEGPGHNLVRHYNRRKGANQ